MVNFKYWRVTDTAISNLIELGIVSLLSVAIPAFIDISNPMLLTLGIVTATILWILAVYISCKLYE